MSIVTLGSSQGIDIWSELDGCNLQYCNSKPIQEESLG